MFKLTDWLTSGLKSVTTVKCRVKPSFAIFWHPGTLTPRTERQSVLTPDVKNYKWRLDPVWHRMLYSCTHMATVGVKGLMLAKNSLWLRCFGECHVIAWWRHTRRWRGGVWKTADCCWFSDVTSLVVTPRWPWTVGDVRFRPRALDIGQPVAFRRITVLPLSQHRAPVQRTTTFETVISSMMRCNNVII